MREITQQSNTLGAPVVQAVPAGSSGYKLFARTSGETEKLLEGLAAGDKLKVRGVNDTNDTNEGLFSPEVEVTVV